MHERERLQIMSRKIATVTSRRNNAEGNQRITGLIFKSSVKRGEK
jgi:hypothetical protein